MTLFIGKIPVRITNIFHLRVFELNSHNFVICKLCILVTPTLLLQLCVEVCSVDVIRLSVAV